MNLMLMNQLKKESRRLKATCIMKIISLLHAKDKYKANQCSQARSQDPIKFPTKRK